VDNISQWWKFKLTEFLAVTTGNPVCAESDLKIISSDCGFEVELTTISK
jgi:hypothetical protein